MAAGSIIIDLLMRTASFVTDTARAAKSMKQLQKDAEAVGKAIGLAFSAAATGAVYFAKKQIDALDALNDVSDATGATIENLSALEDVAARNGQTLEDVSGIVIKFNKALSDLDGKNAASQILADIGLNAQELKDIDPAEALRRTAVALAGFADDGAKARAVQELFGKSIKEAGPFLKDLAEQGQLNAKVTTEQAKAAEEFNKNIFALQKNTVDLARSLLQDLIPALNQVFSDIREGGFLEFLDKIDRAFGLASGGTGAEKLLDRLTKTNDAIAETKKGLDSLRAQPDNGNVFREKGIAELEKRLAGLRTEATATEAEMRALGRTLNPTSDYSHEGRNRRSIREPVKGEAAKKTKDTTKDLNEHVKAYLENLKRLDEASSDAAQAQESFYLSQVSVLKGYQDEAAAAEESLATFGKTREEIEALQIAKIEAAAASRELLAITVGEQTGNEELARLYRDQAKALRETASARGALAAARANLDNNPLAGATQAVKDYLDAISKAGQRTADVTRDALEGVEDLAVSALSGDNVKQKAKQLVDSILKEFYRLYIIRPLMKSILGDGSGGGGLGALIGIVKGLFGGAGNLQLGGAGGTTITPQLVGEFANGSSYIPRTGLAMVHEGERVLTRKQNAEGVGGVAIEVNNYSGAMVRQETSQVGDKKLVRFVIGEVARDSRRGGQTRQATREAVGPRPRRG